MSLKVGDSENPLPTRGMRAVGNATTGHNFKTTKNRLFIPTENADPNIPQGSLDGKQAEPKANPQNHPDPGTRGKKTTFTGQIKTESEIPGDTTPIDNNNPLGQPAPIPPANPSVKTDPPQGMDILPIIRSMGYILDSIKSPSRGAVIPQELADAAKLAGAKVIKDRHGQPVGIKYKVRGMGWLKMRMNANGEITSSVRSLNPAANPRDMTLKFLQDIKNVISTVDADGTSANLLGLEVNLTTGRVSLNGEPIADFPIPGQNILSYIHDKRGNFNLNFEVLNESLKDPHSLSSQALRTMSSLHGGSGSALNSVSDSVRRMLMEKQQFQLSPSIIKGACAEIGVTYDALADYRSEIKGHLREPDILLTTYSKHLQEAKDREIQEDQLVQHAIETTIRQYQTLTGNNLGETNMAYTKEFLTALNLDKVEGYSMGNLEVEDINNAATSAGVAAAAIEINFADFSEKLDGEIPPIHNQACLGINDLKIYAGSLAKDLNEDLNEGNPNPAIRDILQSFYQQNVEQQDANKFKAFKDSENSEYEKAGSSILTALETFRRAGLATASSQNNQPAANLPQPAQEMLLKAAWLVDSNPAISKENAPYLIVGALKDKPEFQDVSLQNLKHLAEASIALKDAMTGPNSPNSLLQKLDFNDPANCQMAANKMGQQIATIKLDGDGNRIGATLYQTSNDEANEIKPLELKYNNETHEFFYEQDPDNTIYNNIVNTLALKFDLKADEIKVSTLNPAPAGGAPAGNGKTIKDENPLAPGNFRDEDEDKENPMFDGLDDDDFKDISHPMDIDDGGEAPAVEQVIKMTALPDGFEENTQIGELNLSDEEQADISKANAKLRTTLEEASNGHPDALFVYVGGANGNIIVSGTFKDDDGDDEGVMNFELSFNGGGDIESMRFDNADTTNGDTINDYIDDTIINWMKIKQFVPVTLSDENKLIVADHDKTGEIANKLNDAIDKIDKGASIQKKSHDNFDYGIKGVTPTVIDDDDDFDDDEDSSTEKADHSVNASSGGDDWDLTPDVITTGTKLNPGIPPEDLYG